MRQGTQMTRVERGEAAMTWDEIGQALEFRRGISGQEVGLHDLQERDEEDS